MNTMNARLPMKAIDIILGGQVPPGVYTLTSRVQPATIEHAVTAHGWRYYFVDGHRITDKASLLNTFQAELAFPSYFGHNWDALEECLNDMSWAPADGYLLFYDYVAYFVSGHPQDWETFVAILQLTCTNWSNKGIPFYVLVRQPGRPLMHLPQLR